VWSPGGNVTWLYEGSLSVEGTSGSRKRGRSRGQVETILGGSRQPPTAGRRSSQREASRRRQRCQRYPAARPWVQQAHVPHGGARLTARHAEAFFRGREPRRCPVRSFRSPNSAGPSPGAQALSEDPGTCGEVGTRSSFQVAEVACSHLPSSIVRGRKTSIGPEAVAERRLASPADGGHGLRDGERVCGSLLDLLSRDKSNGTLRGFRFAKMQVDGRRLSLRLVIALTGVAGARAWLSGEDLERSFGACGVSGSGGLGGQLGRARRATVGRQTNALGGQGFSRSKRPRVVRILDAEKASASGASSGQFRSWRQRKLR